MSIYRKTLLPLVAISVAMLMGSCGSTKDVAYFQNSKDVDLSNSAYLYDARIMPKDQLTITVSTTEQDAAVPFNLTVPTPYTAQSRSSYSQAMLQMYLVDNDGNVNFPIVGTLHLGGLTKAEAENLIQREIKPYMSEAQNPIVTVRMPGYQITVMGEVTRPGTFTVSREKITILEALAQAGDLTIYGVRNNVKLIREDAQGRKTIQELNLNDANIINSPYYYLQQNDVVYVEPRKIETRNAFISANTSIWISLASALMSVATFIIALSK
jgi:polysaccharide export outer membrane protein